MFYTSLLRQRRDSAMALSWCIKHGAFPGKTHAKRVEQAERAVARLEALVLAERAAALRVDEKRK